MDPQGCKRGILRVSEVCKERICYQNHINELYLYNKLQVHSNRQGKNVRLRKKSVVIIDSIPKINSLSGFFGLCASLIAFKLLDPSNFNANIVLDPLAELGVVAEIEENFKMDEEWRKDNS